MASGRRTTTRDRQREATRRRLLEAALEAIRSDGTDGARIDEIAAAAGVSRATFYFHFPSLDRVLLLALAESEARVCEQLDALPADAPLDEVLACTASAIAAEWEDDPLLLREVGTVALRDTASHLRRGTLDHAVRDSLVRRLSGAVGPSGLDGRIPPPLLAEVFLVGLFAAAAAWTRQPLVPLDELLHDVVGFFLRGAGIDPDQP